MHREGEAIWDLHILQRASRGKEAFQSTISEYLRWMALFVHDLGGIEIEVEMEMPNHDNGKSPGRESRLGTIQVPGQYCVYAFPQYKRVLECSVSLGLPGSFNGCALP